MKNRSGVGILVIALLFFVVFLLKSVFSSHVCEIPDYLIKFNCPIGTVIQSWNLESGSYVTIRKQPLDIDNISFNDIHSDGGIVLSVEGNSGKFASSMDWYSQASAPEPSQDEVLPTTGAPPYLIDNHPVAMKQWSGVILVTVAEVEPTYVNIRDNSFFQLKIRPKSGFTDNEISKILSTLHWSTDF